MDNIDAQLSEIAAMSRDDLRRKWVKLTGEPAPRLSTNMLRMALGYEMQAKALGGLSRDSRRQLDGSLGANSRAMPIAPGLRLMREWHGVVHVVTVGEAGEITWNGKVWRSLSEIARTITGTRWSGPAFFGLKGRKVAA